MGPEVQENKINNLRPSISGDKVMPAKITYPAQSCMCVSLIKAFRSGESDVTSLQHLFISNHIQYYRIIN